MGFFPTEPRDDRGSGRVYDNREKRHRYGAQHFRASQGHQPEIPTGTERRVCRQKLTELSLSANERDEGED